MLGASYHTRQDDLIAQGREQEHKGEYFKALNSYGAARDLSKGDKVAAFQAKCLYALLARNPKLPIRHNYEFSEPEKLSGDWSHVPEFVQLEIWLQARMHILFSSFYKSELKWEAAVQAAEDAFRIARRVGPPVEAEAEEALSNLYMQYGASLQKERKHDDSLRYLNKALPYYEKKQDASSLFKIHTHMAYCHNNSKNNPRAAFEHAVQASKYFTSIPNSEAKSITSLKLGVLFIEGNYRKKQHDWHGAIAIFKTIVDLNPEKYFGPYDRRTNGTHPLIPTLLSLAECNIQLAEYDLAIAYLTKAAGEKDSGDYKAKIFFLWAEALEKGFLKNNNSEEHHKKCIEKYKEALDYCKVIDIKFSSVEHPDIKVKCYLALIRLSLDVKKKLDYAQECYKYIDSADRKLTRNEILHNKILVSKIWGDLLASQGKFKDAIEKYKLGVDARKELATTEKDLGILVSYIDALSLMQSTSTNFSAPLPTSLEENVDKMLKARAYDKAKQLTWNLYNIRIDKKDDFTKSLQKLIEKNQSAQVEYQEYLNKQCPALQKHIQESEFGDAYRLAQTIMLNHYHQTSFDNLVDQLAIEFKQNKSLAVEQPEILNIHLFILAEHFIQNAGQGNWKETQENLFDLFSLAIPHLQTSPNLFELRDTKGNTLLHLLINKSEKELFSHLAFYLVNLKASLSLPNSKGECVKDLVTSAFYQELLKIKIAPPHDQKPGQDNLPS